MYKTKQFGSVLKRIRIVVRMFRKSPVKNSVLQKKVMEHFHKQYQLLPDIKTRWNSTETMLERYIKLHDCVVKALKELRVPSSVIISDKELDMIKSLHGALQPIRLVSEALGRRDATLMTAEGSLNFLLTKLKSQANPFATQLHEAILKRIEERRNPKLVSLMRWLQNSGSSTSTVSTELPTIPRSQLMKFVKEECDRLYRMSTVHSTPDYATAELNINDASLEKELEDMIQQHAETSNTQREPFSIQKVIQKELALFELTGELTPGLNNMYKALKSIKPTSTDSERVFSDSANICTKKRSSLQDSSINELCFLKSYFKRVDGK